MLTKVWAWMVTCKSNLIGSIERTLQEVLSDRTSVKDFGAKGDGDADDTVAIQAAVDSLFPAGGRLYFPKGRYKITEAIQIKNMPIVICGDGMYSSSVEQHTPGSNGFIFSSDTVSNAPSTDGLLINSLQFNDISVNRGYGSGGHAVSASWRLMTSNSPQAIFERFRTYSKSDAGRAWEGAIDLRNCNGLKISTVQLHGNPLETQSTVRDPYTMRFGIRLSNDGGDELGLISFFIDKLTVIAAGVGIDIFGWHEGVEISNCELVQVAYGIRVSGNAVHQNPDLFYLNSHIEARITCVQLSNVFKAKFTACDLFQYAALGNTGSIIELNGCTGFSCTGTTLSAQRGAGTYVITGISSSSCYHGNVSGCSFIGLDNGVDVLADSWMIGDNLFYQVTNPIRLYGNLHTIGVNKYTDCANKILYSGTGHQVTPIKFNAATTMNVTQLGTQQAFSVNIPSGIFREAPDFANAILLSGSTSTLFSVAYNRSMSSATSARFEVTTSAAIGAGNYLFSVELSSRP